MSKENSDHQDLKESLALFEKDFKISSQALQIEQEDSWSYKEVFQRIHLIVEDLMNRDFNTLINTLYRIDVSEQRLKEALASTKTPPSKVITEMIIVRELQKVKTRRKYS